MDIWRSFPVEQDTCYAWDIGPLRVYSIHSDDEWHIAMERDRKDISGKPAAGVETKKPEEAEWVRWIPGSSDSTLALAPRMPDRPVVVRFATPLRISAEANALFSVGIPLWTVISVGTENPVELCDEPVTVLSNTWFGEPDNGELCYSLTSRALRNAENITRDIHLTVCPVHIINKSRSELAFERLCIRAPQLAIYSGEQGLVSSGVSVTYKGEDQKSSIDIEKRRPSGNKNSVRIAEPRKKGNENIMQKSFGRIISYTGL